MEICEGWNADDADSCHPRTESGGKFPSNLSFTGAVRTSTIMEHQCVFLELNHIILSDGKDMSFTSILCCFIHFTYGLLIYCCWSCCIRQQENQINFKLKSKLIYTTFLMFSYICRSNTISLLFIQNKVWKRD